VFRSCLAQNAAGDWSPDGGTAAGIYTLEITSGAVTRITEGTMPTWRPEN